MTEHLITVICPVLSLPMSLPSSSSSSSLSSSFSSSFPRTLLPSSSLPFPHHTSDSPALSLSNILQFLLLPSSSPLSTIHFTPTIMSVDLATPSLPSPSIATLTPASPSSPSSSLSPPPSPSSSSSPPKPQGVKRRETGLKHMVAGSVAGMAAKTILQPLDLIKVRLQVQDGKGANEYRGVVNAIQRVVKEEGFLGLYRGLTPNLMAAGVSWGTYFFSYNQFKDFFKRRVLAHLPPPTDPSAPPIHVQLGPLTHLACAAASGALATTLTNPVVMVKTRLQLQGKEMADALARAKALQSSSGADAPALSTPRGYSGMLDAFRRIVREEGFFSLYRGLGPSLVLVSNGSLQFMAYEELKELCIKHLVKREEALKSHHYFLMGGLAKIFSATVTYPFAVTRSRLFARNSSPPPPPPTISTIPSTSTSSSSSIPASSVKPVKLRDSKYSGMWDAMRHTWRNEGWRGFYRGLTPQLLKTAPSSAITFLIYETVVRFLNHPTIATTTTHQPTTTSQATAPH